MLGKALWEGLLLELPLALTADNLEEYIDRVAYFRLNVELRRAVEAFMLGFHELIDPEWVVMFNEHEMQTLISGRVDSAGQGLDLEDMRAHTHYQ
ncbi:ubiquitin-protein ligase E3 C, partial [Haematococcus lacustris]